MNHRRWECRLLASFFATRSTKMMYVRARASQQHHPLHARASQQQHPMQTIYIHNTCMHVRRSSNIYCRPYTQRACTCVVKMFLYTHCLYNCYHPLNTYRINCYHPLIVNKYRFFGVERPFSEAPNVGGTPSMRRPAIAPD